MKLSHLNGECILSRYQAPTTGDAPGRIIAKGFEEIEFLTNGRGRFLHEGREQPVGKGCILWHIAGDHTIYRNDPEHPYECLVFRFPIQGKPLRQLPQMSFWDDSLSVDSFLRETLNAYHNERVDKKNFCLSVYTLLFWQAYLDHIRPPVRLFPQKLKSIVNYMDENWNQPIDLSIISQVAGLSIPHLHYLCKEYLQVSPHQYILSRRLQESRNRLLSTTLLIKEIAGECGFTDLVNFGRIFKKRFGVSPNTYRQEHTSPDTPIFSSAGKKLIHR